jgi:hypothetical protein
MKKFISHARSLGSLKAQRTQSKSFKQVFFANFAPLREK